MTLIFNCIGQSLMRSDNTIIAENSQNFLKARFDLDESWNGLTVTACFKSKSIPKPIHQVLIDGECDVPWEVIKAGEFRVSLLGTIGDDDSLIRPTSTEVRVPVESGPSLTGQNSAKPTPTDVQQITNLAQSAVNTANSVREDADSGKFDGEDGKDGASFEVFSDIDVLKKYPGTTTATKVRFVWGGDNTLYSYKGVQINLFKYGVYDGTMGFLVGRYFSDITEILDVEIPESVFVGEEEPEGDNVPIWVEVTKRTVSASSGDVEYIDGEPVNYAKGWQWVSDGNYWRPDSGALTSAGDRVIVHTQRDATDLTKNVLLVKQGEYYRVKGFWGDGASPSSSTLDLGLFVKSDYTTKGGGLRSSGTTARVVYYADKDFFDILVPSDASGAIFNAYYTATETNGTLPQFKVYKFTEYPEDPTSVDPEDPDKNSCFAKEKIPVEPEAGEVKLISETPNVKYKNSNGEYVPVAGGRFRRVYQTATFGTKSKTLPYWFYEPYHKQGESLPLILVLHSSMTKQLIDNSVGIGINENLDYMVNNLDIEDIPKSFYTGHFGSVPAYILMPQTDGNSLGWAARGEEIVKLVNLVKSKHNISYVAVVGFSLGATGAWELAAAYPDVFNRILPIAGGLNGVTDHIKPYVQPTGSGENMVDGHRLDFTGEYAAYASLSVDGLYMKSLYTPKEAYRVNNELTVGFKDKRINDVSGKLNGKVCVWAIVGATDNQVEPSISTSLCSKISDAKCTKLTIGGHEATVEEALKSMSNEILGYLLGR